MNKLALISATALAALAASAGTASANSFCVQDADCVAAGGKNEGNNLQAALNDAAILNGDDEVHLGPDGQGRDVDAPPGQAAAHDRAQGA